MTGNLGFIQSAIHVSLEEFNPECDVARCTFLKDQYIPRLILDVGE